MAYRLLEEFGKLFSGKIYRHRVSTQGDWVSVHLFEDLVILGRSQLLVERVASRARVRNVTNRVQGIRSRRGDGTFGDPVPGERPVFHVGYLVGRARTANIEIGVEVKILAKAMIKQIDRVCSDLKRQADEFRSVGGHPITVGIVGINHAERCVSYEGTRPFETTGKDGFPHPYQEAREAENRLLQVALPHFDHFLLLHYKATNDTPYPFSWVDERQTTRDYGAMLVRISTEYDERFH